MAKRVVTRQMLLRQARKIKADVSQMIVDAEYVVEHNPNCRHLKVTDLIDLESCKRMTDFADSIIRQVGPEPERRNPSC